jgi:hypothetical protein
MNLRFSLRLVCITALLLTGVLPSRAHDTQPDTRSAMDILKKAMQTELDADKNDHSRWRFRDDQRDGTNTVSIVVQTGHGSVKRVISRNGVPLTEAEAKVEDARVQNFIHDSALQAKQRKDGAQDDKNATELLKMLPDAFVWNVKSQNAEKITLHFQPNPNFSPPDMQARVLGAMEGEIVVNRAQSRIETLRGHLMQDVMIGWGILGRLRQGGTFQVERREIAPGLWQIVETHVHIDGKVLFFKSIGQQEDEVQSDFSPIPDGTTMERAAELSKTLK